MHTQNAGGAGRVFSGAVRTHRQRIGLTQEELAAKARLSLRAVGKIESGRTIPRPQTVRLLADAFGLVGSERERFVQCAAGAPASGPAAVSAPAPARVPAQLPADVSQFLGREEQLGWLDDVLTGRGTSLRRGRDIDGRGTSLRRGRDIALQGTGLTAVVISAVAGTAGIGKTALTIHWAHRVRDHFPDGQLYVNLRGYDPDQPMTGGEALVRFLTALGVAGADIPFDLDDRAALYRTAIADRRMLIVLDNAGTVEQVRPLLPGSPTCVVVVTSRDSLPGLAVVHGARRLDLDVLPPAQAIALLRRSIGARADADPDAIGELAHYCAGLPLALRIAAELVASRPPGSLGELVAELADQRRRLELLDVGGDPRAAIGTVFSWSLRHLPPAAVRTFGLLGHHPGPDFDAYAAAALAGIDVQQAQVTLDRLARAHLLHRVDPDRWGMHDLLRAYASGLADAEAPPATQAGLDRLLDYYLATTVAAVTTLYPTEVPRLPAAPPDIAGPDLTTTDAAKRWLRAEQAALVMAVGHAATHDRPDRAIDLSIAMRRFLTVGGHHVDELAVHGHALDSARRVGDRSAEAMALVAIGSAHINTNRAEPGVAMVEEALQLSRLIDDQLGQARALNSLAISDLDQARTRRSFERFRQALDLYRAVGDASGITVALTNLANAEARLGRYDSAVEHLTESLETCRQLGNTNGVAQALCVLGYMEAELCRYDEAVPHLEEAIELSRQTGRRAGEAGAMCSLGAVYSDLGQHDRSVELQTEALVIAREIDSRSLQCWVLNDLGRSALAAGRLADAFDHHAAALVTATEVGARDQQASGYAGLARAHESAGDLNAARDNYETALAIYLELGLPEATKVRDGLAALTHRLRADHHTG